MVHVLPHWNWAGKEGQTIPVMAYTNAEEVELFLNGKSLGRKKRFSEPVEIPVGRTPAGTGNSPASTAWNGRCRTQPGSLKAVAYQGGKQVAVGRGADRRRAGPRQAGAGPRHHSGGWRRSFVRHGAHGGQGRQPGSGGRQPGALRGDRRRRSRAVDNGNAATVEPFQADHRKAFSGMALLIVNGHKGQKGRIHVVATSDGLSQAATDVTVR